MFYQTVKELPKALRAHLPLPAQEIFRRAYNGVWDSYADNSDGCSPERSRQDAAHKAAWLEVRRTYLSEDGSLVYRHRPSGSHAMRATKW